MLASRMLFIVVVINLVRGRHNGTQVMPENRTNVMEQEGLLYAGRLKQLGLLRLEKTERKYD